jgi:hypothetical protein
MHLKTNLIYNKFINNMHLQEFIDKYNGKFIDLDGYPKGAAYQCWDLAQEWFNQIGLDYWLICKWSGGVKDIWEHRNELFDVNEWEFEQNEYHTIPKPGDVVVFDGRFGGGYGHIAIVIKADINTLTVFEQNAGLGIGGGSGDQCKITTYPNYRGVYGFIRKRGKSQNITKPEQEQKINWTRFENVCGLEHTNYFKNIVNDNNWPLACNDYVDRVCEKQQLENENQSLRKKIETLKNSNLINQSHETFSKKDDILIKNDIKTQQKPKETLINKDKQFWQSKKFMSLVLSAILGILSLYLSPENINIILNTIASIEIFYLGGQTLIDTNVVNIFKNKKAS